MIERLARSLGLPEFIHRIVRVNWDQGVTCNSIAAVIAPFNAAGVVQSRHGPPV